MWVHQYKSGKFVRTWDQGICNKVLGRELVSAEDVMDMEPEEFLPEDDSCPTWFGNDSPYGIGKVANQDDISKGETYQMGEHQYLGLLTFEGRENIR